MPCVCIASSVYLYLRSHSVADSGLKMLNSLVLQAARTAQAAGSGLPMLEVVTGIDDLDLEGRAARGLAVRSGRRAPSVRVAARCGAGRCAGRTGLAGSGTRAGKPGKRPAMRAGPRGWRPLAARPPAG